MFGYEVCQSCGLYHLSPYLENQTCVTCLSKDSKYPFVPLSTTQYRKLYQERVSAIKYFLKPTVPSYVSDLSDHIETRKEVQTHS